MKQFLRLILALFGSAKPKQRKGRAAVAGGLVGAVGLITITATHVVGPPTGIPQPGDFPTPSSVGPAVDPTVTYAGDCNFDATDDGLVIDDRIVDCGDVGVRFAAGNYTVTFTNSIIQGMMFTFEYTDTDPGADTYPRAPVFVVEDSKIIQTSTVSQDRAACCSHFTIRRSYIQGKHSGVGGHNNVVLDGNYITTDGTDTHSSGMRILKNSTITNNTIVCQPVTSWAPDDAGCSAAGVYYAEQLNGTGAASYNLTIDHNYFHRGTDGNGLVRGPYNATRHIDCATRVDCTDRHFTNNLFDLGWGVDAGEWPFYGNNTWSGNYWVDGQVADSGENR